MGGESVAGFAAYVAGAGVFVVFGVFDLCWMLVLAGIGDRGESEQTLEPLMGGVFELDGYVRACSMSGHPLYSH